MSRPYLRPPPGLSRLSQEVLFDDHAIPLPNQESNEYIPPRPRLISTVSSQGPNSGRSNDYKPSFGNIDEDVNLPLLPLNSPQTIQFPATGEMGADRTVYLQAAPRTHGQPRGEQKNDDYSFKIETTPLVSSNASPGRRFSPSAQANCSVTPSPSSSKFFDTPPPTGSASRFSMTVKEHPFAKGFEVPQWRKLAIHVGLCALSYPFLLIFIIMSRGKSLFWTRLFVGAGCGLLGFMLGISLLALARGILEAATWATVIHQSRVPDAQGSGVRLKDLAAQSDDPTSSWPALRLLWDRHSYRGADREYRKFYDDRKWSVWIVFFLSNVLVSGTLPFILARVVTIDVQVMHQHEVYSEVAVQADLSDADINRANAVSADFENYTFTWTLSPFSMHGSLPGAVSLTWQNASVYFAEVIPNQLVPGGSGFGTFSTETTSPSINLDPKTELSEAAPSISVNPGSILRFPRWGIQIECAKIPDATNNIIPLSENNLSYVFTPRDTLRPLFDKFQMQFPDILQAPVNFTQAMHPNDTIPIGLDSAGTAMAAMFWDNGVAHSIKSSPLSMGDDGKGFITIETILVRLNDTYAPKGSFGVKGNFSMPEENGFYTFIGYDAVVCLELYEPWVLEVYNSSVGLPSSTRIVDKAAEIKDINTQFIKEQRQGNEISDPLVKRLLNSTGLGGAYIAGHQNSVNQILKDNGRDSNYVPSPMLISFTDGSGPYGYTNLSALYYAKSRALADASNVLPYFAGSGLTVARQYPDKVSTEAWINLLEMAIIIVLVLAMGAISALFVPRLPLDTPRRGFDLYSWLSAFYAHELVPERTGGFSRHMDLREIKDHAGELKFRYVG